MMEQIKLVKILGLLLAKTEAGDLGWEEINPKEYLCAFGESGIVIEHTESGLGENLLFLAIRNDEGREVERISDEDFPANADAYKKMSRLWNLARSNALGTDKLLDDLLDVLED